MKSSVRSDANSNYEFWVGETCFGIWEPAKIWAWSFSAAEERPPGPACRRRRSHPRAELEAKGVEFNGDTFDTGVCHMALFFPDPDGNDLMLHHR